MNSIGTYLLHYLVVAGVFSMLSQHSKYLGGRAYSYINTHTVYAIWAMLGLLL